MAKREIKCNDCGRQPTAPMLKDEVWELIAGKRDLLCMDCAEYRLGREIVISDLADCVGNAFIFRLAERYGID